MFPRAGFLLLTPFFLMSQLSSSHGRDAVFYVGTYTKNTESQGIYRGRLNTDTGDLAPVLPVGRATNPTYLTMSPNGKFLYAAMEGDGGRVGAFAVREDGSLTALNSQPSGGDGACHVSTDSQGRHVFVANYGGGTIACLPVRPDGSLGEASAVFPFHGSGPDPRRQTKSYAHSAYSSPDDRFVYACDLGSDQVWTFAFDPDKGSLVPTDPPTARVPPGGGPRHLAFHPNGRFVFANNEMGLSVTAFARDPATGLLSALETHPTAADPETSTEGVTTSALTCHPSGRWLYVSCRGSDLIAVYANREDGRLSLVENAPAQVAMPRGMALDPTGRWLVVAGQKDHSLTVLTIDPDTGKLSPTGQTRPVPAPVSVTFAP